MARSITFRTLTTPANFAGVAAAGGNLAASTTYYYRIIAIYGNASSNNAYTQYRSAPSAEIAVATGVTDKSVALSWDAVTGASGYMIWRTKESGNYDHKYVYGEGAGRYKCKILRTGASAYQSYSTTGTTYTDDGTVTLTETTQSNNAFEFFDFAVPRIDISGGDAAGPFSMEYLYQQDLSNGWGVIVRTGDKIIGYTYTVKAHIYASAASYWREEMYNNTWVLIGGGFVVQGASTVIMGYETTEKAWIYGVRIILPSHTGYYSATSVMMQGTINLYNVDIIMVNTEFEGWLIPDNPTGSSNYRSQCGRLYLGFSGTYILKGCRTYGGGFQNQYSGGSAYVLEHCDFNEGSRTLALGGGSHASATITDVNVKDSDQCINVEGNIVTSFRGGKISSSGRGIFLAYEADHTCIDTDLDETKIQWYAGQRTAGNFAELRLKNSFNLKAVNLAGAAVEGATVALVDKNGASQFSQATGADGKIIEQIVTRIFGTPADNTVHYITAGEKTDYNPFTLTISKAGYETYRSVLTIDKKVDMAITLKPSVKVRKGVRGEVFYAVDADNGSDAKLMEA